MTGYEYEEYFMCDVMHLGWKLINRLSHIITNSKKFIFSGTALRLGFYLLMILGLLIFYMNAQQTEISFVYSAF